MALYSLCVDSSIRGVALALLQGEGATSQVVWQKADHSRYGSAGILSQYFRQALDEVGATVADITRIVVSTGPGSFTGIKVGLAWCYGLAAPFRREVAWLGVSALEEAAVQLSEHARADAAAPQSDVTSLLLPSTTTHGYLAQFNRRTGGRHSELVALEGSASAGLEKLLDELATSQVVIATGWPMMADLLADRGIQATNLSGKELMDHVLHGLIVKARQAKESDFQLALPKPRYLRKSTAEERLELQRG